MNRTVIKVMLVDDHQMMREGCRHILQQQNGIEVVAEAGSGDQAYRLYSKFLPNVVVMDISMPGISGLECLSRIMARDPGANIIIFTMHESAILVRRALKTGAKGFLTKQAAAKELVNAVQTVVSGETYLDPAIARIVALENLNDADDPLRSLSRREIEILRLLANGLTNSSIGEALHVSAKTVANYRSRLKKKLRARTSADLVRIALNAGIADSRAEIGQVSSDP